MYPTTSPARSRLPASQLSGLSGAGSCINATTACMRMAQWTEHRQQHAEHYNMHQVCMMRLRVEQDAPSSPDTLTAMSMLDSKHSSGCLDKSRPSAHSSKTRFVETQSTNTASQTQMANHVYLRMHCT